MRRIGNILQEALRRRVLANAALYIAAAWVSIQVADLAIEAGLLRWALRDVFVGAFLGFPVALIVGWFYDITRHGLVRTAPADADQSFDKSLRSRDYLLFASLAAAWAGSIFLIRTPVQEARSIAILPFENPGSDPDNAIFGFGLRVDLQTQLQGIRGLTIIARESSDKIDPDEPLRDIGMKLGVAYIMKGSVERVLDRVRVNVILVNAASEEQSWAGSFDRQLTAINWFDIRNEISSFITEKLRAQLSPAEQDRLDVLPTDSMNALQSYFRGKQRLAKRTSGALAEAIENFQQAVELDPSFALAYVGLADSHYLFMLYGGRSDEDELPKMETAVRSALALDDELGEAYATLAVLYRVRGRTQEALSAFERSIALNPNYATARQWYGSTLVSLGRLEEGLLQKLKALELDPLSAVVSQSVGMTMANLGRFDEALAQYESAIEIDASVPGPYERIAELHRTAFGRLDEAVVWQRKGIALDPDEPMGSVFLGFMYLDLGDPTEAERWFERSAGLAPPGFPLAAAAFEPLHLFNGDEGKALDAARVAFEAFGAGAPKTLAHLRNHDIETGRFADARVRYQQVYPELFAVDPPDIDDDNFEAAIDLALVFIKSGEQEKADWLLKQSLAVVRSGHRLGPSGYGISDVLIRALQGQTEKALAALRQAIDQGWREDWWFYLEHDPNLDSVRGDPRFQSMLAEIKADMATQLGRVRAMQAEGRLTTIPGSG